MYCKHTGFYLTSLDVGLSTLRSRLYLRSQNQDLSLLISGPRPWSPGGETRTLAFRY